MGIYYGRVLENPRNPYPLGRHIEHDDRSREYRVSVEAAAKPVTWPLPPSVLDQGNLGSCVGHASLEQVHCGPNRTALSAAQRQTYTEDEAVTFYHWATSLDDISGTYPPVDTGSTGIGGAKAAQHLGFISGYLHAFSLADAQSALMAGPVMFGTVWTDGMFDPDSDGVVHDTGSVAGGHEYLVYGQTDRAFLALNSWGTSWGLGGKFVIPFDVAGRLLQQEGDVTQFVPLTSPAPTPTPPPAPPQPKPSAEDLRLVANFRAWAKKKGIIL